MHITNKLKTTMLLLAAVLVVGFAFAEKVTNTIWTGPYDFDNVETIDADVIQLDAALFAEVKAGDAVIIKLDGLSYGNQESARIQGPMRALRASGQLILGADEAVVYNAEGIKEPVEDIRIELTEQQANQLKNATSVKLAGRNVIVNSIALETEKQEEPPVETLIGKYFVNTDLASQQGWTPVTSGGFNDTNSGLIGEFIVNSGNNTVPATVDETHLATEYCFGFECRWATNYSSFTQESFTDIPAGSYKLTFDVENVNENTQAANYENRFTVTVGDQVFTDQATEWMQGQSAWTSHAIEFSVLEDGKVTISFGYGTGSNNLPWQNTPALYVSHLALEYVGSASAAAIKALQAEIAAAEELLADESKTQGRSQFEAAINDAKSMLTSTDVAAINAAIDALKEAEQAFLTANINMPVAEGVYYLYNPLTEKFLSRGSAWGTSAVVDDYGVALNVTVNLNNGQYSLTGIANNTTYGDDSWMYADAGGTRARTYLINAVNGGYTLTNTTNNQLVYVYLKDDADKYRVAGNAIFGDNYDNEAQTVWQFLNQDERNRIVAAREAAEKAAAFQAAGLSENDELVESGKTELTFKTGSAWTFTPESNRNSNVATNDNGSEIYQGCGTFTQNITNLESGLYKVSIQAFLRDGSNADVAKYYDQGLNMSYAYLQANDTKIAIKSWGADRSSDTAPNSMGEFNELANQGKYLSEGYAFVGEDGQLNLTVAAPSYISYGWFIASNVTYAKMGFDTSLDEVIAALQAEITKAEEMLADESKTEGRSEFQTAIDAAKAALDSSDAAEIYAAIDALQAAENAFLLANNKQFIYDGVAYIIDAETGLFVAAGHDWGTRGIINEIGLDLTFTSDEATRTVTIDTKVFNGDSKHFLGSNLYMDSDAFNWILEEQDFGFYISNGTQYLNIDAEYNLVMSDNPRTWIIVTAEGVKEQRLEDMKEASESNPVSATWLLQNPNFNRNDQRVNAWQVSEDCTNKNLNGGNSLNNCAESYHSTFTISQLVEGAPAGTYTMTAQGFYRQDDEAAEDIPVFFANGVTAQIPAKAGEENNMSQASESFTAGLYTIEPITFTVGEDGKLEVGVQGTATHQWVIWDNFQLTYLGKSSAEDPVAEAKAALQALVDAETEANRNSENYTAESWQAYSDALAAAKNALADANATVESLNAAKTNLENAIKALAEKPLDEGTVYVWNQGQEAGGTAVATDGQSVSYANDVYTTIRLNGKADWSTDYVTITLDKALKAGDKIAITAYRNKDVVGKTSGAKIQFAEGVEVASETGLEFVNINKADDVVASDEYAEAPNTCEFTVPEAADGVTTFKMTRSHTQTNLFITKIEITEQGPSPVDEAIKALEDAIAQAEAMLADETNTEGREELQAAIDAANAALQALLETGDVEAAQNALNTLEEASETFEEANKKGYIFDGVAYIIDAETGKFIAAGHDWGTRGIVNEIGLDLTFTSNAETGTVTIDTKVSNGGDSHFLGENLYMDSPAYNWTLDYQNFGFYITNGTQYINIDKDDNLVLSDTPREWIIVTAEGVKVARLEEMAEATASNPVDATWMLQNPNYNRNDQRVSAWVVSEDCTNKNLNGGNNVNNCAESYHSPFTISQEVIDAPKGVYAITAQGFYRQDGDDFENMPVFFANDETMPFPVKTGNENSMSDASASFTNGLYTIDPMYIEVAEGGTLTVGTKSENANLWVIWDNFQLTYYGPDTNLDEVKNAAILTEMKDLRAKLEAIQSEVESETVLSNIAQVLAQTENVSGEEAIKAAIASLKTALDQAEASVMGKNVLPKMKELVESTNVYTEEALNEYYTQWEVKYQDGTLTKAEAAALQDPSVVTGWHASITCDNFLLSAWDAQPDVFSGYYINTWSVEGDSDGSNFHVPFFEYWTGDGDSLGEKVLTATMNDLEEGNYEVTAWVRVRMKNGAEAPTYGITLSVNDGAAVNVADGPQVGTSQMYLKDVKATGKVGADGVLKIQFNVAADNNISWLSFKNVKFTKKDASDIEDGVYDLTQDMFKHWESHEATEGEPTNCAYELNTPTGLPYGDSNVFWLNYANLSGYDKLVVLVSEGTPRFCFNRTEDNAQDSGNAEDSKFIDIPGKEWGTEAYQTADEDNKRFIIDLKKMTEERGFAHLHCIKGAYWQNVTVKEMKLVKGNVDLPSDINAVKADMKNATIYNLNGQKVEKTVKGLYIVNGKKVVLK